MRNKLNVDIPKWNTHFCGWSFKGMPRETLAKVKPKQCVPNVTVEMLTLSRKIPNSIKEKGLQVNNFSLVTSRIGHFTHTIRMIFLSRTSLPTHHCMSNSPNHKLCFSYTDTRPELVSSQEFGVREKPLVFAYHDSRFLRLY